MNNNSNELSLSSLNLTPKITQGVIEFASKTFCEKEFGSNNFLSISISI